MSSFLLEKESVACIINMLHKEYSLCHSKAMLQVDKINSEYFVSATPVAKTSLSASLALLSSLLLR